jgi:hypothetical protein
MDTCKRWKFIEELLFIVRLVHVRSQLYLALVSQKVPQYEQRNCYQVFIGLAISPSSCKTEVCDAFKISDKVYSTLRSADFLETLWVST